MDRTKGKIPFTLKGWAFRGGKLIGLLALLVQGLTIAFHAAVGGSGIGELFVRTLIIVPFYWFLGAVLWGAAYVVARVLQGTAQVVKTTAPTVAGAAIAAGQAAADAVEHVKQSPLEKRLAELDKLHAEGKITAEERAAARSAALARQ